MKILRLFKRVIPDSCEAIRTALSAYADGEATRVESARVESHIAECRSCAEALESIRGASLSLAGIQEVESPRYLQGAILAATTALDAVPVRRPALRLQWGFGAAAMAGILVAFVFHANQAQQFAYAPAPQPSPSLTARETPAPSEAPTAVETEEDPRTNLHSERIAVQPTQPETARGGRSVMTASIMTTRREDPVRNVSAARAAGAGSPLSPPARKLTAALPAPAAAPAPSEQPAETSPLAPAETVTEPAPKIEMATMNTPMAVETMKTPMESTAAPAEPVVRKITLVAESRSLSAGQVASLADLKKSLRQQSLQWNRPEAMRGLNGRQINVELVKRSF
jgi:hypothetical protein